MYKKKLRIKNAFKKVKKTKWGLRWIMCLSFYIFDQLIMYQTKIVISQYWELSPKVSKN